MKKIIALILGAVSIFPLLYSFYFINSMISVVNETERNNLISFNVQIVPFVMLPVIIGVIYIIVSKSIPKEKKLAWAGGLFIGHAFVLPFVWYKFIWSQINKE